VVIQNVDNMLKVKYTDIFKKGAKFKVKKINFNDPEVIKMIDAVKEEQRKILKRKEVDINQLRNTVINI
jgi:hypothetical protein